MPAKQEQLNQDRQPHAYLSWGTSGHEREYLFTIHPNRFTEAQIVPPDWESRLEEKLGSGWRVLDRGARIELMPPSLKRNEDTDRQASEAVQALLAGENYVFKVK